MACSSSIVTICSICREPLFSSHKSNSETKSKNDRNQINQDGEVDSKDSFSILVIKCGHLFHKLCINTWFAKNEQTQVQVIASRLQLYSLEDLMEDIKILRNTCPCCNKEVDPRESIRVWPSYVENNETSKCMSKCSSTASIFNSSDLKNSSKLQGAIKYSETRKSLCDLILQKCPNNLAHNEPSIFNSIVFKTGMSKRRSDSVPDLSISKNEINQFKKHQTLEIKKQRKVSSSNALTASTQQKMSVKRNELDVVSKSPKILIDKRKISSSGGTIPLKSIVIYKSESDRRNNIHGYVKFSGLINGLDAVGIEFESMIMGITSKCVCGEVSFNNGLLTSVARLLQQNNTFSLDTKKQVKIKH